jgi:hypothetical protein
MAELLAMQGRRGVVEVPFVCPRGRNFLQLFVQFGGAGSLSESIGFRFVIEQRVGPDWCVFGEAHLVPGRLRTVLDSPTKFGTNRNGVLLWRFNEQLVADARGQETTREYQVHGRTFKQFALCPQVRFTFEAYTLDEVEPFDLEYAVDLETGDREYPVATIPRLETR